MEKKEILAEARKIAADNGVKVLYHNTKGEYFTDKNRALDSVGHKEDQVETFDFSKEVAKEKPAASSDVKPYILTKKDIEKYPELSENGWKGKDEVKDLDWALTNKKPEA